MASLNPETIAVVWLSDGRENYSCEVESYRKE